MYRPCLTKASARYIKPNHSVWSASPLMRCQEPFLRVSNIFRAGVAARRDCRRARAATTRIKRSSRVNTRPQYTQYVMYKNIPLRVRADLLFLRARVYVCCCVRAAISSLACHNFRVKMWRALLSHCYATGSRRCSTTINDNWEKYSHDYCHTRAISEKSQQSIFFFSVFSLFHYIEVDVFVKLRMWYSFWCAHFEKKKKQFCEAERLSNETNHCA